MFDIGWSELLVIAVVALIAIGPKELPGVLRAVGQWMGKARRMAAEFQGQFNEAMREAEMADLKKSFDEVRDATGGLTRGSLMTRLTDTLGEPPRLENLDKPGADREASASGPLAITPQAQEAAAVEKTPAVAPESSREAGRDETVRDAKAS